MSSPKGFNMVELMITVAIIAIIIAASIPAVLQYSTEGISLDVTREVTQQLRGLRHLASSTNRALIVTVSEGDGGGGGEKGSIQVLQSADNRCNARLATDQSANLGLDFNDMFANVSTGRNYKGRHNVQIVKVSPAAATRFCIKPDGRVLAMNGQVASNHALIPSGDRSAVDCTGLGYEDVQESRGWPSHCNKMGMLCLKIAHINTKCPDRCTKQIGDCTSHIGIDHIVTMSFSGETRMVQ